MARTFQPLGRNSTTDILTLRLITPAISLPIARADRPRLQTGNLPAWTAIYRRVLHPDADVLNPVLFKRGSKQAEPALGRVSREYGEFQAVLEFCRRMLVFYNDNLTITTVLLDQVLVKPFFQVRTL